MHRAGTSAFARAVNLLGVPLADQGALKAASPHNPAGFWEVPELTDFNDQLLLELGGHWSSPTIREGWAPHRELESCREAASELFARLHPGRQWVWKDPRNCVLLPFWAGVLEVEPVVVLSHRSPIEIARSLRRRDGLANRVAIALWERYMRLALTHAAGRPTLVVRFDRLVEDPHAFCSQGRDFLLAQGVRCHQDNDAEVRSFVRREFRHEGPSEEARLDGFDLPDPRRRLLSVLADLEGPHSHLPRVDLPPESPETEALLEARRDAVVALGRLRVRGRKRLQDAVQAARERESLLRLRLDKARARNESLRAKLERARERAGR